MIRLIMLLVCLIPLSSITVAAAQRIVILNPAAGTILKRLTMDASIVGVTFHDEVFSGKVKVGSHLQPNIELIKTLNPDLLVVGSTKAFPAELSARFNVPLYRYDPRDLQEILQAIHQLGVLLDKQNEAQTLTAELTVDMKTLKKPAQPVSVVFEISQRPLKLAGQSNIVTSIIHAAGGINMVESHLKHVLLSPEKILVLRPQLYLYQNGPMNKNPVNPKQRNYFQSLTSQVEEVDQLLFTRPGLNAFEAVTILNQMLLKVAETASP